MTLVAICKGHNLPGPFDQIIGNWYDGAKIKCTICNRVWILETRPSGFGSWKELKEENGEKTKTDNS